MKKKKAQPMKLWGYIFVVNLFTLYILSLILPGALVLGTVTISPFLAGVIASLLLVLVGSLVQPAVKALKVEIKEDVSLSAIYTIVNIITLWLIGRGAIFTGLGISSFYVAILAGIFLSVLQYYTWKKLL